MSIYREEAIESLISSLRNSEFPAAQIAAAETIVSLQGRFTVSGKSLTRAFLLKQAGHGKIYKNLMRMEQLGKLSGEIEENLVSSMELLSNISLFISIYHLGLRMLFLGSLRHGIVHALYLV